MPGITYTEFRRAAIDSGASAAAFDMGDAGQNIFNKLALAGDGDRNTISYGTILTANQVLPGPPNIYKVSISGQGVAPTAPAGYTLYTEIILNELNYPANGGYGPPSSTPTKFYQAIP